MNNVGALVVVLGLAGCHGVKLRQSSTMTKRGAQNGLCLACRR
jgi:hypothetical protein